MDNSLSAIDHLRTILDPLTVAFADLMRELAGSNDSHLWLGAVAACMAVQNQNACTDLSQQAGQPVLNSEDEALTVYYPLLEGWLEALKATPTVIGAPGHYTPLVLAGHRLYLYRYWDYEQRLAQLLKARAAHHEAIDPALAAQLQALYPPTAGLDWQAVAVASALGNRLSIITGGPGTGKTTTVSRMLALLLTQNTQLRVVLAAPTGKAAARMKQALDNSRTQLNLAPELQARFPQDALTLHRLLGYIPGQIEFRHGPEHPLPWDVVIVDEASMIDLPMMTRLVQALRPDARLILLGDEHQLASVETGCVLGDICAAANPEGFSPERIATLSQLTGQPTSAFSHSSGPLDDRVIALKVSRRFHAQSGIGQLALAVNHGESAQALTHFQHFDDLQLQTEWSQRSLTSAIHTGFSPYLQTTSYAEALQALEQFIFLTVLRRGPRSVAELNQTVEQTLRRQGLITHQPWYHRRPVLITENDYVHQLYNGDIGVVWAPPGSPPRVWFRRADGSLRDYAPAQLGAYQTAWALTVHKSQGSEFDQVHLVLPAEPHPLVTRELIYTGITRGRKRVTLWSNPDVLTQGISQRMIRTSGLKEQLQHG